MCSNTSSSGGVSGSCGGGGGDGGDYASLLLKKPKRQRVPKRGPGVAELEKILREQENKHIVDKGSNVVPMVVSDHNNLLSPPPPPMTMLYANNNVAKNNNIAAASAMVLPDHHHHHQQQALLPTMWSNGDNSTSIYGETHNSNNNNNNLSTGFHHHHPFSTSFANGSDQMHHLMLPKKHCQYTPSTINLFPQSGPLSSSDNPSAAGFYHHLEHPSNQRSHHNFTSLLPDEEIKMVGVGMKRPRTFSIDSNNNSGSPFHCQVSPPFPHVHLLDESSLGNHHQPAFNLKRHETVSRDHAKKCITDYGALNGNFLLFGSPTTPSLTQASQQEFSKYNPLPFQESMEGSHQISGQGRSVEKKPFYSFLLPEEQTGESETALSLNNERSLARGECIDLNLKL